MDILQIFPNTLGSLDGNCNQIDKDHIAKWRDLLSGAPYIQATFSRDLLTCKYGDPVILWHDCKAKYDINRRRYYETKLQKPDLFAQNLGKWTAFFSDGSAFLYQTAGQARGDREDRNDPDAFVVCIGYEVDE